MNCNLQAGPWVKKDIGIQKDDYEIPVKNNVLVVKIEDLVRIWQGVEAKKIIPKDLIAALTCQSGWLECKESKLIVHK